MLIPDAERAGSVVVARPFIHGVEKLIGYARLTHMPDIGRIRGSTKMKVLVQRPDTATQGIELWRPVLDNPISTGVWGQISSSAAGAGLFDADQRRVNDPAALWPKLWPTVAKASAPCRCTPNGVR